MIKLTEINLCDLPAGKKGIIKSINRNYKTAERLKLFGFDTGEEVKKVAVSPFGDPSAYLIGGTVVALRRSDAKNITVTVNKDS